MTFKLNYNFYFKIFYIKNVDSNSWLKLVDKLAIKFKDLMTIYKKTFSIFLWFSKVVS